MTLEDAMCGAEVIIADEDGAAEEALSPLAVSDEARSPRTRMRDHSVDINDPMILEINKFRTPAREAHSRENSPSPSPDHGVGKDIEEVSSPANDDDSTTKVIKPHLEHVGVMQCVIYLS